MEQKNFATAQASYDYVLQLDADEVLTDELRQSIRAAKQNWQGAGYTLARLTNYCGTWVRHGGWYPDRKLRLYDRRLGRWTGLLLHERYEVNGRANMWAPWPATCCITPTTPWPSTSAQLNRFTSIAADELLLRGKARRLRFFICCSSPSGSLCTATFCGWASSMALPGCALPAFRRGAFF